MIQINLLPQRGKRRKVSVHQIFLAYVASVALTLIIIGIIWLLQKYEIEGVQTRLARVEEEVRQYAQYEALDQDVTKKKQLIDKKLEIIASLKQDRDTLVRLMALLSVDVPAEKIWLERLAQSGNSMTLNGVAMNNEAIAEFMRNLESSDYIVKGTVNLARSKQITIPPGKKLREFELKFQYAPFSAVKKVASKEGT